MTTEVESFLDELYQTDWASHQLVNQAILGRRPSPGPASQNSSPTSIWATMFGGVIEW